MGARPSGTVTFLFSDVEGSTRLWEHHPEEMASALGLHDSALRSAMVLALAVGGGQWPTYFAVQ